MSLNVVDTVLENNIKNVGFIPSRRQIEFNGGYVNNWTTESFSKYVNGRVAIERDHGGPLQGKKDADLGDDALSFQGDTIWFDIIHIDPWKQHKNVQEAAQVTARWMQWCDSIPTTGNCLYEVGTEEAIRKLETSELEQFIKILKSILNKDLFSKIAYLVIQSGTSLREDTNTGHYDADRLSSMLKLCSDYGLMSKEHNGDFLSVESIKERFDLGLNAINIAPEFGQIETQCYIDYFKKNAPDNLDLMFKICLESGQWKKWVSSYFDPYNNKEKLIKITGHYIFSDPEFLKIKPNNTYEIKEAIKQRIYKIVQT